ncbi:hypothetical protein PS720_01719 [Pseudomonas fluorescens]|nr:hypothetical protein PS720_01719 [Pseudomonas fluorescens]
MTKKWRIASFFHLVKDTSNFFVRNFFFIFSRPILPRNR